MHEQDEIFGAFDLGLSPEQEERAARLHAESLIIDLLYWGPIGYRSANDEMLATLQAAFASHHDLARAAIQDPFELGGTLAVAGRLPEFQAAWKSSGITGAHYPMPIGTERELLESAAHLTKLVDGLPWVRKVLSAADFTEAKRDGQLAYFAQCQPERPISADLSLLDLAYDFGLRMLQLTYNEQDLVGAGCTDRTDAGVSNFGKRVIERCNQLGVIVDTSHAGKQTVLDACEFSTGPVIASHTSAEAVYQHDRGMSDEELRAIAATGGVIGVVTVPFFLAPVERASILDWLDHVDHIVGVVGWQHVAIGTDWPLAGPKWSIERLGEHGHTVGFTSEHGVDDATKNLRGFDDYRDMPNLTRGLVSRGYTDEQVQGILGANALSVFERVIG